MRTKLVLSAFLLLSAAAFAKKVNIRKQHIQAAEAACGDPHTNFTVVRGAYMPKIAPPAPGMARVYLIETTWRNYPQLGLPLYGPTMRVGLDGRWVGATGGNSYVTFTVSAGEHHLCFWRQSKLKSWANIIFLAKLTATAGATYYFYCPSGYNFHPYINPDEAKLLLAQAVPSVSTTEEK